MKRKGSLALEGMGMYLIAVILAILTLLMLVYLGGFLVNKLYYYFKEFFSSLFGFL